MQQRFRRAASVGLLTLSGSVMLCGCQSPPFFGGGTASSSDPAAIREAFSPTKDREHEELDKFVSRGRESASQLGRPAADPPRVQGLLQQGHEAVVRGNADEARRLYQLVLDEQPDHPVAHHRLGILADRGGQYATAERHYLRALRGRPTDADLLSDLGYSYFLQGRPIESEKFLREALQADPGHRHARDNLSVLFDRSKAESVLRTVQSPREASQTLASLFDDGPNSGQMDLNTDTPPEGVDPNEWLRQKMAAARTSPPTPRVPPHSPPASNGLAGRPMNLDSNMPPEGVDPNEWMRQKMVAARTKSPAELAPERRNRPLPHRQPQNNYPPPDGRIPDEHLATVLRDIDRTSQATRPRPMSAQEWPTRTQSPSHDPRMIAEGQRDYDRGLMAPDPRTTTQVAYGPQMPENSGVRNADFDSVSPAHTTRYDMNARNMGNPAESVATHNAIDNRPEAPRWENIPEQNWSQIPTATQAQYDSRNASGVRSGAIQQTDYTVARQAAEVGMQTGPGAMFPGLRSSDNMPTNGQPRTMASGSAAPIIQPRVQAPPRRQLPGSNSQTQGTATPSWHDRPATPDWSTQDQYSSSNWNNQFDTAATTPGQWPHANGSTNSNGLPVIQPSNAHQPQPGVPADQRYDQNGSFPQNPGQYDRQSEMTNPPQYAPQNPGPLDAYDRQRQEHAASYNTELQQLATQRGQWGQGSADRPAIPPGMMTGPDEYHSYRPEDYNLRPETGSPDYRAGLGHDYGTGAAPVRYAGQ